MNRRTFLQSTLAGTGFAGLPVALSAADPPPAARRRIRIGFLGASHSHALSKIRIASQSPDFQLVGICEENQSLRRSLASLEVPLLSQQQLLMETELVAVESDVKDHAKHAHLALEAGKHVHLEKPPADTMQAFRELVALAENKKRLLQMGYMWRFHPAINAALEAARQGWLGDVYLVRATINTAVTADRRPEWAQFRGGTMFELGAHVIDPVVRLLGRPNKVTPFLRKHGEFEDNLADNTVAIFEYTRAMAVVTSATLQPGAGAHRFFEVLGTNGTALIKPIEPSGPTKLQLDLAKSAGPYSAGARTVELARYERYAAELAEIAEAIRRNKPLAVTPAEDLLVHETLMRACDMPA